MDMGKLERYKNNIYFGKEYTLLLQKWAKKEVEDDKKLMRRQCPVCGSSYENPLFKAPVYTFFPCKRCGLVHAKNVLNDSEINKFYKNNEIYQLLWKRDYDDIAKKKDFPTHNSIVKKILQYRENNDKCLDIGCGFGKLLYELKPYFKRVQGIELNLETSKRGGELFGIRIFTKELKELNLPSNSYDVIILNQVIEHLNDFNSLFKEVYRILKPSGIVYIGCPNMDSISMKLFKEAHIHVSTHAHINMFNRRSLIFLAEKHGFSVEEIKSTNELDITLIDVLYFYFNRQKFVHRHNYNAVLTPISLLIEHVMERIFNKLDKIYWQVGRGGSYLEVIFKKSRFMKVANK
ncbi:MAG: class I SAM-dependent methyltransferase [Candidatus Hadarchaeaceae archaeon]